MFASACLQDVAALVVVRWLELLVRAVPLRAALPLGRAFGWIAARATRWRATVLRSNVRTICSGEAATALGRHAFEHLGQAILLSLQPSWRNEALRRALRCDPAIAHLVDDARAGGVIVCSAHLGVWELLPRLLAVHLPLRARDNGRIVFRPLHNRFLDRWVHGRRLASGLPLLADRGSMDELRRAVDRGGLVGMLPDQRPSRPSAIRSSFIDRPTDFPPGFAALHAATGAPVWFAALLLDDPPPGGGVALRLDLKRLVTRRLPSEPAYGSGGSAKVICTRASDRRGGPAQSDVTTTDKCLCTGAQCLVHAYAHALSCAVRAAPSQYFWWHRRWRGEGCEDDFQPCLGTGI